MSTKEEYERSIEHLRECAAAGQKYVAVSCDRIGELNNQLSAITEAGWRLHSVVPFHLPAHITTDPASYFAVIAERRDTHVRPATKTG